jgi:FkbM family methyltransferase
MRFKKVVRTYAPEWTADLYRYLVADPVHRRIVKLRRVLTTVDAVRLAVWYSLPGEISVLVPQLGRKILIRGRTTDLRCFEKVLVDREYDSPFQLNLDPKLIVDAGANTGIATNYFAAIFPRARIVAIEPEAGNAEILRRNCSGLANVSIHEAAIWPTKDRIQLVDPGIGAWAYAVRDGREAKNIGLVETITIEQILHQYGSRIDILKLDIEGAELELMRSSSWLDYVDTIIIELHDRYKAGCAQSFYTALAGRAFRQEIKGENIFVDLRVAEA